MRSNRLRVLLIAALLVLILSACGDSVNEGDPVLVEGERLFNAKCISCHPTGADQPRVGPYLVGLAANLEAAGQDAAAILDESIRNPGEVVTTGYQDLMPPADVLGLSDADVEAIIAYLSTLR